MKIYYANRSQKVFESQNMQNMPQAQTVLHDHISYCTGTYDELFMILCRLSVQNVRYSNVEDGTTCDTV